MDTRLSIATPAFQHPRIIKTPPESLGTRLVHVPSSWWLVKSVYHMTFVFIWNWLQQDIASFSSDNDSWAQARLQYRPQNALVILWLAWNSTSGLHYAIQRAWLLVRIQVNDAFQGCRQKIIIMRATEVQVWVLQIPHDSTHEFKEANSWSWVTTVMRL